jgi:hypothetical protein
MICRLRQHLRDFPINARPDPTLQRDLKPGFLLPALLEFDAMTYGRWDYWLEMVEQGRLPERPIPPIDWLPTADSRTRKMIEAALDAIPRHGEWRSLGGWQYLRYLLEWMLWGFAHPGTEEPKEPFGCEGASMRLYQVLNIHAWVLWPFDYLGELMAENAYGRRQGFFPTPMAICELLSRMTMDAATGDLRTQSVCDPAAGTGRLLLAASNRSLCLYGMDIDPTLCLAALVNGYLYAPWLARPLPFLTARTAAPPSHPGTACMPPLETPVGVEMAEPAVEAGGTSTRVRRPRKRPLETGQETLF